MSYEPGLYQPPGDDTEPPGAFDEPPAPDDGPTVDTPDPFGTADQSSYGGAGAGPDVPMPMLPPWGPTRAPGTVRTIAAGVIVPLNPWAPVIALLNADQLALLNSRSAAAQAAMMYAPDDERTS